SILHTPAVVAGLDWVDAPPQSPPCVSTGAPAGGGGAPRPARPAAGHWLYLDRLPAFGAQPTGERVVFDGKYVTAAGVSSGIDMGLTLLGRIAGDEFAQTVQLMIEYDPQPPYDAGSPDKAPADLVARLRAFNPLMQSS
ncbi:DJ-1/PfpI family protein, partial [Streptomyces sp. NPDC127106]